MKKTYICACEQGKHTVNIDNPYWKSMALYIKEYGENMEIFISGKEYSIPRIYTAMHGIKGKDLSPFEIKK